MLNTNELNTSLKRTSKTIAVDAGGILAASKAISQIVDDIININPNDANKDVLLMAYFSKIFSGIDLLETLTGKLSNDTKKLKETAAQYHNNLYLTSG